MSGESRAWLQAAAWALVCLLMAVEHRDTLLIVLAAVGVTCAALLSWASRHAGRTGDRQ